MTSQSTQHGKPEERPPGIRAVSLVLALVAIAPLASLVVIPIAEPAWNLIALIWLVGAGAVATRSMRQRLDKTDPFLWVVIAMLVMFAAHPAAKIALGEMAGAFRGYDVRATLTEALAIALAALIAFCLGSAVGKGGELRRTPTSAPAIRDQDRFLFFGRLFLVLGLIALAIVSVRSGVNPLTAALGGGQRRGAATDTAYLYLAPQILGPASLCYLYVAHLRKRKAWMAVLICMIQVIYYVPLGSRLVLLTCVVPTVIAASLLSGKSTNSAKLLFGGVFVFLLLVSVRDLGSGSGIAVSDSLNSTVRDPGSAALELFTGNDTEMIDGLALEARLVPASLPHAPFSTIINTLASPVPRLLWSEKPQTFDGKLNFQLFGIQRNNAGVAYSFVGELFYDSGYAGVIIGFALFGFILAKLTRWLRENSYRGWLLVLAGLGPLSITLARGSLALTVSQTIYTTAPIILVCYFANRSRRVRMRPRPSRSASPVERL